MPPSRTGYNPAQPPCSQAPLIDRCPRPAQLPRSRVKGRARSEAKRPRACGGPGLPQGRRCQGRTVPVGSSQGAPPRSGTAAAWAEPCFHTEGTPEPCAGLSAGADPKRIPLSPARGSTTREGVLAQSSSSGHLLVEMPWWAAPAHHSQHY